MSKRTKSRSKIIDVVFIVDSTESTASFSYVLHRSIEDLAFDLQKNYRASFNFACICYRDPVDEVSDVHQVLDFDEEIENLALFLEDVKPSGGGDGPEDFAGALSIALDQLSWRNGKKIIFWFADGPAHGKRFCYIPNHQEEEPKLVQLVERIAKEGFYFVGLSERNNNANYLTLKTFYEMREIFYQNCNYDSKHFKIESIHPYGDIFDQISEKNYSSYDRDDLDERRGVVDEALFEL